MLWLSLKLMVIMLVGTGIKKKVKNDALHRFFVIILMGDTYENSYI